MRITVLDGYTLNPGDLSWDGLKSLGSCQIYDRTPPGKVIERARKTEILIVNKVEIDADTIRKLHDLKYIGLCSTGYNVVDIDAAAGQNIPVTNVPAYSTLSVAQMTFAHILNLCHHVSQHSESVKRGDWSDSDDFCYWNFPLVELQNLTLGIIGFGRIGQAVAGIAETFGMNIIYHDINTVNPDPAEWQPVELNDIFIQSDIITLHCPLTPETKQLVDKNRLEMMKPSAVMINTSRGPLINEQDLADALNSGHIAAAGLDVLSSEPPESDNPLLSAKNCYITPHIAWATQAARKRLMNVVIENIQAFLNNQPVNVVNSVQ